MQAVQKFCGKAKIYAKHRPGYPKRYFCYLKRAGSLSSDTVIADIGSGTGIFTRYLLQMGYRVFGVEPNNEMRAQSIRFLKDYPLFHPISGSAENTGLPSKSIDLITAAQLFHWFDADAFRTECQRILKPNGKVALILNTRDESSRIVPETAALFRKFCTEFKGFSNGIGTQDAAAAFFADKNYECKEFENPLVYDRAGFLGRNLSASFSLRPGDPNFSDFVRKIEAVFDRYQQNDIISLPNFTRSYFGEI